MKMHISDIKLLRSLEIPGFGPCLTSDNSRYKFQAMRQEVVTCACGHH